MILAKTFKIPRIAAMRGKEAPLINIVTIKVGNCSRKLWWTL